MVNDPTFLLNSKLLKVNFESLKTCQVIQKFNVSRFIFASTASVYGLSKNLKK